MELKTDDKKVEFIAVSKTTDPEDAKRKLEEKKAEDFVSVRSVSLDYMTSAWGERVASILSYSVEWTCYGVL